MNELDLLLAEIVEASRHRRQMLRASPKGGRTGKIKLAKPDPRSPGQSSRTAA